MQTMYESDTNSGLFRPGGQYQSGQYETFGYDVVRSRLGGEDRSVERRRGVWRIFF